MRDAARELRALPGGLPPGAWERLWPQDVWRQEELPHRDLSSTHGDRAGIRFTGFAHAFLKEAAKRWAKTRVLTGTSIWSLAAYVRDVACFSSWLAGAAWQVAAPAGISRAVLEDYLLWVRAGSGWAPATQQRRVVALRLFLDEQRLDGLAGLPAEARIDAREAPRVDYRPSLAFDEFVFAQLTDPAKLALVPSITTRTAIVLLANTGLRISSVITLAPDPLERGADGQPYLRYENVKFRNRERLLPVSPLVEAQIRAQQAHNAATHVEPVRWLLPSPPVGGGGKGGAFHVSPSPLNRAIKRWVELADIRDAQGRRPRVFPHAFRHHVGTSMVNANVPLPVVQRMLDHSSIEMTAHYARIHDSTLRREWESWQQRVNVRGERIALPADGPAAEAAWMKERLARAKQALPNGFCGLPLVQTCPHPNACLSCENFLTDPSFRPQHEQHLERTRDLLGAAEQRSHARQVELLKRDERSLVRILEGLAALEADDAAAAPPAAPDLDLRELASPEQEVT
jgi:integrase